MVRYGRSGRWGNLGQSFRSRTKVDPDAIELCTPLGLSYGLFQALARALSMRSFSPKAFAQACVSRVATGASVWDGSTITVGSSAGAVCVSTTGAVWVGWSGTVWSGFMG